MKAHQLTTQHSLPFILGGKATFTLRSKATGTRFTYKVTTPKSEDKDTSKIFWVKLLTGSDNESSYSYLGYIKFMPHPYKLGEGRFTFIHGGSKSSIGKDAKGFLALNYTFNGFIAQAKECAQVEVWHEGKCCRCGRKLTVPESIESGIGPECGSKKAKAKAHFEPTVEEELEWEGELNAN